MKEKIASPKKTMDIVHKYDFIFQKRFGQNFLIDFNIIDKIILGSKLSKEDTVIEIGPGIGSLTQALSENAKRVIAIEIDKKLIPILEETLNGYENITIINEDILKVNLTKLIETYNDGKPVKIIANLPYYITTPIIMGIFEKNIPVETITVMVQKEVAERMQATPGNKEYGALSLAVQYYSNPQILLNVAPSCFIPKPKVGSSVITLNKYTIPPVKAKDEELLFKIIKASFNQRRKTLLNSISNQKDLAFTKDILLEVLHKMDLDERVRGEALSLEAFCRLTNLLIE